MKKQEESRRAFLIGTAVGASAVAGAGLVPTALAQTHEQHTAADAPATTAQGHAHAGGHGAFLNDDDAVTVTAFAERIMPGAPGKPGARDAGVINYIDLALAGAYSDLQDFYRRGLAALDAHCRTTYNKPFVQLDAAQQDEVITALEGGKATGLQIDDPTAWRAKPTILSWPPPRAEPASRKTRVPPRSWCRFQADAAAGLAVMVLSNWPPSAAPTSGSQDIEQINTDLAKLERLLVKTISRPKSGIPNCANEFTP
jgi:hypothetical protein